MLRLGWRGSYSATSGAAWRSARSIRRVRRPGPPPSPPPPPRWPKVATTAAASSRAAAAAAAHAASSAGCTSSSPSPRSTGFGTSAAPTPGGAGAHGGGRKAEGAAARVERRRRPAGWCAGRARTAPRRAVAARTASTPRPTPRPAADGGGARGGPHPARELATSVAYWTRWPSGLSACWRSESTREGEVREGARAARELAGAAARAAASGASSASEAWARAHTHVREFEGVLLDEDEQYLEELCRQHALGRRPAHSSLTMGWISAREVLAAARAQPTDGRRENGGGDGELARERVLLRRARRGRIRAVSQSPARAFARTSDDALGARRRARPPSARRRRRGRSARTASAAPPARTDPRGPCRRSTGTRPSSASCGRARGRRAAARRGSCAAPRPCRRTPESERCSAAASRRASRPTAPHRRAARGCNASSTASRTAWWRWRAWGSTASNSFVENGFTVLPAPGPSRLIGSSTASHATRSSAHAAFNTSGWRSRQQPRAIAPRSPRYGRSSRWHARTTSRANATSSTRTSWAWAPSASPRRAVRPSPASGTAARPPPPPATPPPATRRRGGRRRRGTPPTRRRSGGAAG